MKEVSTYLKKNAILLAVGQRFVSFTVKQDLEPPDMYKILSCNDKLEERKAVFDSVPKSIKDLAHDFYYEEGIDDYYEEHKPMIIWY